MRVLVLGGTRFIGPAAVRRLLEHGHEVAVFHRGTSGDSIPDVQHLHGERSRLADFTAAFHEFAPDVVLDMFALTEADAQAVVQIFRGIAKRLVVVSSVDVYRAYDRFRGVDPGPPDPVPLTEDSPLRDRLYPYRDQASGPEDRFYHYEKILVERAAMSAPDDLPGTIIRLPMVYGPGDYQHRLFEYLKRMDDGRAVILLPEDLARWRGLRSYVEDVGEAIALCVTRPEATGRTYHVAEPTAETETEWVQRIGRVTGWTGEIRTLPNAALPEHLRHSYCPEQEWYLDSSRIRTELGFREITPPEVAMRRTIEWERANPPATLDPARFDYPAEDAALGSAVP